MDATSSRTGGAGHHPLDPGDGLYDRSWAGVVMVWVGSSSGLRLPVVTQPVISIFTDAGVDFARRAGTQPQAVYSVPVSVAWSVPTLCDRLREITEAPVVSGTRASRREAAATITRR